MATRNRSWQAEGPRTDPPTFMTRSAHPLFCFLLTAYCFLLTTGCVERSLTIRTQPPGAMVYLNDRLMGDSPVSFDFVWYGWHRVILRKDGFERVEDHRLLRAPVYLWIPIDFVMELLPLPIRDRRTWDYTLTPAAAPPAPVAPPLTPTPAPAVPTTTEETHDAR